MAVSDFSSNTFISRGSDIYMYFLLKHLVKKFWMVVNSGREAAYTERPKVILGKMILLNK